MEETYEDKDKGLKMTKNETSCARKRLLRIFLLIRIFFVTLILYYIKRIQGIGLMCLLQCKPRKCVCVRRRENV